MITQLQVPLVIFRTATRGKQMLHRLGGHETLAQAHRVLFAFCATTHLTHSRQQEISCVDNALILAVLAHIEELQLQGIVRDECGEVGPLQQGNLAPAVEVVTPRGFNTHLVELLNCLGIGNAAERRLDGLQRGNIGSQHLQFLAPRLQSRLDDRAHQALFDVQQDFEVAETNLRLNQHKLGQVTMISPWLGTIAVIDRVHTPQRLAMNQWLQVQLGGLRQERSITEVIQREQRRKIFTRAGQARDGRSGHLYEILRLHEMPDGFEQRPTQAYQRGHTRGANEHMPVAQLLHILQVTHILYKRSYWGCHKLFLFLAFLSRECMPRSNYSKLHVDRSSFSLKLAQQNSRHRVESLEKNCAGRRCRAQPRPKRSKKIPHP